MIEVEHLTKRYAGRTAVNGVTFTVGRGEIAGLLGPNGAGKSTIMRILSGYMPASSGTVRVAGYDVFTQADEVRRRIGYMPENNPLHKEMRVREYLKFRARLKGLSRQRSRERVDEVMARCSLTEVCQRIIGQLSKGYQQRVGLADALVHEPDLIILDEPTLGLDPNQIRAVRQLIKDLGRNHTILLSSHILPEVEMTCNRILILHQGRILAAGTAEELHQQTRAGDHVVVEIAAPVEELRHTWEGMPEIERHDIAAAEGDYQRSTLTARPGTDLRPLIHALSVEKGWRLRELTRSRETLEDVFVRVTHAGKEE